MVADDNELLNWHDRYEARCRMLEDLRRAFAKQQAELEHLREDALHEVECPNCGATIRARMADRT